MGIFYAVDRFLAVGNIAETNSSVVKIRIMSNCGESADAKVIV